MKTQIFSTMSYHSAATDSANAPCTNIPLSCPLCHAISSTIWKYNMKTHFAISHPSATYESYSAPFSLGIRTSQSTDKVGQTMEKETKKGGDKGNKLPISEAHSTWGVFLCVSPSLFIHLVKIYSKFMV